MSIRLKRSPTDAEAEQICIAAEEAVRKRLLSSLSLKLISDLDVTVEAVGDNPLVLNVEVAVELSSGDQNANSIVDEAMNRAFSAAEAKAKELQICEDTPN